MLFGCELLRLGATGVDNRSVSNGWPELSRWLGGVHIHEIPPVSKIQYIARQRASWLSGSSGGVGAKRPNLATGGTPVTIQVNSFVTTVPEKIIHHYDVVISPSEKTLPTRMTMALIRRLQFDVAPQIFTPLCVYDGRKNMFSIHKLKFDTGSQVFDVTLADESGPKVYKIKLTHVAEINPEVLHRFIQGKGSHDNTVLTAITALNVVVRMQPSCDHPFNVRSFYTDRETKDIGAGLELCKLIFIPMRIPLTFQSGRGYFQSVRPGIGKMLINVDISTGMMYKHGPLMNLCLEFLRTNDPRASLSRLSDRERLRLQRFISGIRILTNHLGPDGQRHATPRIVRKLSSAPANKLTFTMRDGQSMTVAEYFRRTQNRPLQYPDVICAEIGSGALIPLGQFRLLFVRILLNLLPSLELCNVPPGQFMRKQIPPEKTKAVLDFATKKPLKRLESIRNGLSVLAYGQSDYPGPLTVHARVLKPPTLKYGPGSRSLTITPRNGSWNMVDKKFFKPVVIERWVVVIYEQKLRFGEENAKDMMKELGSSCRDVGIKLTPTRFVSWGNGQGRIADQLKSAGGACVKEMGKAPQLLVVILPEGGNDIYTKVKHFGDVTMGVATQCLKSSKCYGASSQYFANVCLKINVKLGGINTIPGAIFYIASDRMFNVLTDPHNPTIVIHPAPGSDGRPSFTALVANVDSDTAKYIATSRVQTSRQEMIDELEPMSLHCLTKYMKARAIAPKRIIFYRDGVSEGQFKHVLEQELPLIKKACASLKINPKITFIVVGKRHHVRFFPINENDREADRSGNCKAGTVVDRDIVHPTEFDFYLQAHGGLLGTSRPAHYSVLYDENNFSADTLQSLSFALCHVYARSTRSVSIPAPVYYADIVCSRAKNHYDPQGTLDFSDSATQVDTEQAAKSLEDYKNGFLPLNAAQADLMYFS
ncbi:argonaute-like protein [Mycena olivaceomarginata]|nr:argonaute-like protein [Mycena olivaceomarginata]